MMRLSGSLMFAWRAAACALWTAAWAAASAAWARSSPARACLIRHGGGAGRCSPPAAGAGLPDPARRRRRALLAARGRLALGRGGRFHLAHAGLRDVVIDLRARERG